MLETDKNTLHAHDVNVQKFNPWAPERFVENFVEFEDCSWWVRTLWLVKQASSTLQPLIMFNFHFLKLSKNTEKIKQNSWKIIVPRSTLRKYLWYSDHIIRNFIDELNSNWKLVAFYFRGLRQNPGPCNLSRPWVYL